MKSGIIYDFHLVILMTGYQIQLFHPVDWNCYVFNVWNNLLIVNPDINRLKLFYTK